MINRILLRIKVIQILYAFYKGEDQDYKKAEGELKSSIEHTYELYLYLLMLIPAITDYAKMRLQKKNVFSDKTTLPSLKFVNNLLAKQISENEQLNKLKEEYQLSWDNKKTTVIKALYDDILNFDLYQKYNEKGIINTFDEDKDLWKKIFRQVIASSEILGKELEDESIYWNSDEETAHSFAVKTIKNLKEEDGNTADLLPMFKDEDDRTYVMTLFKNAVYNSQEYTELIDKHINTAKWDIGRVAFMDRIIMQTAIAELMSFPSIPVNVTLNEYIEIAKDYSTDKSNTFINGILDAIINDLRSQNKLMKVAYYSGNKE